MRIIKNPSDTSNDLHNIIPMIFQSHRRLAYLPPTGDPDYVPIPNILLFESLSDQSVHRECINISVSNDSVLEDTEHFDVVLSSPDSAVHVMQGTSRVYIIDDDGVRVGLRERSLVVPEGRERQYPSVWRWSGGSRRV